MVSSGTKPETAPLTTGIRIDLEADMDDALGDWAEREGRSKREHVKYLVRELLETYAKDPLIIHRIALVRGGKELVPASAR